jgi:hypothetical protein
MYIYAGGEGFPEVIRIRLYATYIYAYVYAYAQNFVKDEVLKLADSADSQSIHTPTQTCTHTYMHMYMHTRRALSRTRSQSSPTMQSAKHTHIHTAIHAHIHTCTCMQNFVKDEVSKLTDNAVGKIANKFGGGATPSVNNVIDTVGNMFNKGTKQGIKYDL